MIIIAKGPSRLAYVIPSSLINRRDPAKLMLGINLSRDWVKQLGLLLDFEERKQEHLARHQRNLRILFNEQVNYYSPPYQTS